MYISGASKMKKILIILLILSVTIVAYAAFSGAGVMFVRRMQPQINTVGLIGHWKLQDGFTNAPVALTSDGAVFDYSLNGNPGVIDQDDAVTVPVDKGFSFDGADSLITVGADAAIDINGRTVFSVCAWINPASDGEGNEGRIISKVDATAATIGYSLYVLSEAGGLLKLYIDVEHLTADARALTTVTVVPINVWSHVAAIYNEDADGKCKLYLNGVLIASNDQAGDVIGAPLDDSAVDLIIGNSVDLDRTFHGLISDVQFYNKALTAIEVKNIYEVTRWRYSR